MEIRARNVLQEIAPNIEPKVLLVGIRTPEKNDSFSVCVEPENEDWDPTIFFHCASRADEIYKNHPDHNILYGDAPSMEDKPENIRKQSVREAVKEVALSYDAEHETITYCGYPTKVAGYYVVPVFQFAKATILTYPHLPAPIKFQDWTSSSGFLDSTITCLLEEATKALQDKDPGRFLGNLRSDKSAILRMAGDRFCAAITLATEDIMLQEVFDQLNIISSLPYEGAEAIGELLFAPRDVAALDTCVRLEQPVPLREYKLARKVIEMSNRELSCICQGAEGITGFCNLSRPDIANVFRVSFSGHYKWDLYYKNTLLMKTAFGVSTLPSVRLSKEEFCSTFGRLFPAVEHDAQDRLWLIIDAAMQQTHGTMIVLSDSAEKEAKRLKTQSLGIQAIDLTPELVTRFSGIDGAILIDPSGIPFATQ